MGETGKTEPAGARPAEGGGPGGGTKPTPARELARAEPRPADLSAPPGARAAAAQATDLDEVALEAEGLCWKVRVRGRSGSSDTRSPPLLLLGFWAGDVSGEPEREATVVARALSELPAGRLAEALAESSPPRPSEGRKPFFEGATQGRKGGS